MLALFLLACEPAPDAKPADTSPPVNWTCPPEGTQGVDVGDTVLDLVFRDCESQDVRLHDQCGTGPTLMMNMAGWCGPCYDHLDLAIELMAAHASLSLVVAIGEDPLSEPADAAYCADLRDLYGGAGHWLMDHEQQMEAYGGPGTLVILDPEGVVLFNRDDAIDSVIVDAVEAAL